MNDYDALPLVGLATSGQQLDQGRVCVNTLSFNVAGTAGLYSQLAGVLAGFAFAALVVILTSRLAIDRGQSQFGDASRALVPCFLALILVSVSYAVLAGESGNSGRAAVVQLLAADGFVGAGMLLLLAILALLQAVETASPDSSKAGHEAIVAIRVLLAHILPIILVLSLYSGIDDYKDARFGAGSAGFGAVDWLVVTSLIAVAIIPLLAYRRSWKFNDAEALRHRSLQAVTYGAVLLSTAALAAIFVASAMLHQCDTVGPWIVLTVLAAAVMFMTSVSIYIIRAR